MPKKKKEHITEHTEAREEAQPLAFIAVDLETTGLNRERDEIIEIGAVRFQDGLPGETFKALVNPQRDLSPFIKRLTGITQDEVDSAPVLSETLPKFLEFIGDSALVFHNSRFDLSFLRNGAEVNNTAWDTLTLSRCLLPQNKSHSKDNLCKYFRIETGHSHRAYDDALATGHLFVKLHQMLPGLELSLLEKMSHLALPGHRELIAKARAESREGPPVIAEPRARYEEEPEPKNDSITSDLKQVWGSGGQLSQILKDNYEERPEQEKMALAVMDALEDEHLLLAEAGTGTGKSLAYLIPAVIWSRKTSQRVIISTHTKNLQEQLFYKDIPLLRKAIGHFEAALLKGRSNYLCLRRWQEVSFHPELFLNPEEREEALILLPWSQKTKTGDIAEHGGFNPARAPGLWGKICSDVLNCQNNHCPLFNKCFLRMARRRAEESQIVVVNHSLLFSDLSSQNRILPEYQRLVIDEAHNIERVATDLLGYGFSRWDLSRLMQGLYSKRPSESGLLMLVSRWIQKSKADGALSQSLQRTALDLAGQTLETGKAGEKFLAFKFNLGDVKKLQEKKRYLTGDSFQQQILSEGQGLVDMLLDLASRLDNFKESLGNFPSDQKQEKELFLEELGKRALECRTLANTLGRLLSADDRGYVYWAEPGGNYNGLRLVAGPLEVGAVLNEQLYPELKTAVFTSATLTVEGSFDFFKSRVGLMSMDQEMLVQLLLASPFDFKKQAALLVPQYLPSPKTPQFNQSFIDLLHLVLARHQTGGLVLFTSFDLLNRSYQSLLESGRANILAQGIDGHPSQLIEQSLSNRETVIFGTNSFWEGVDLPGQALELLVISKLPFSVPSDPLVEARCQVIEQNGNSSFHQYLLPEAVIRFRQGFGRLIRNKTDKGLVIVADSRIINTEYGKTFIRSLPALPVISCRSQEELVGNVLI